MVLSATRDVAKAYDDIEEDTGKWDGQDMVADAIGAAESLDRAGASPAKGDYFDPLSASTPPDFWAALALVDESDAA